MKPLPPLKTLQSLFNYDPATGTITYRHSCGRRAAGQPAGGMVRGLLSLCIQGEQHWAGAVAWALAYGQDPTPSHVSFVDRNPENLARENLFLSDRRFCPPKGKARRAKRQKWQKQVVYSARDREWKVYHNGKVFGYCSTKKLALDMKRAAMKGELTEQEELEE
jgi:hypothetical protein